jgi:hypothetical protein
LVNRMMMEYSKFKQWYSVTLPLPADQNLAVNN